MRTLLPLVLLLSVKASAFEPLLASAHLRSDSPRYGRVWLDVDASQARAKQWFRVAIPRSPEWAFVYGARDSFICRVEGSDGRLETRSCPQTVQGIVTNDFSLQPRARWHFGFKVVARGGPLPPGRRALRGGSALVTLRRPPTPAPAAGGFHGCSYHYDARSALIGGAASSDYSLDCN